MLLRVVRKRNCIYFTSAALTQAFGICSAIHFICTSLLFEIPQSPSGTHTQKACHHKSQCFCAFAQTGSPYQVSNGRNEKNCRTHNASDPPCTTKKFIHLYAPPTEPTEFWFNAAVVVIVIQSHEFYGLFAVYQIHALFGSLLGSFVINFAVHFGCVAT